MYTTVDPQIIPSYPVIVAKSVFPVNTLVVGKKKSMARFINTNHAALFAFSVPKDIMKVNKPHIKKYAAIAVLDAG